MTVRATPRPLGVGPFRSAEGLRHVSESTLRGTDFRRVIHGVHIAADTRPSHGWQIQAVRQRLGPDVVLIGTSAAFAHGVVLAGPNDPVQVAVGSARVLKRRPGVVPVRADIHHTAVVSTSLGLATSPARTALDLARGIGTAGLSADRRLAVVEVFVHGTPTTVADVRRAAIQAPGLHGLPAARVLLAAARDGVGSPRETELRLLVVRAGFPEPEVQCRISLDGRIVASLDLGWREYRAGAEYDGAGHRDQQQHAADMDRHNRIRLAGWTVLQVGARSFRRPDEFLAHLARLVPRRSV